MVSLSVIREEVEKLAFLHEFTVVGRNQKRKAQKCEAIYSTNCNPVYRFRLFPLRKAGQDWEVAISGIRIRDPAEDLKAIEESPKKPTGFSDSVGDRRRCPYL
jgi:hypothetical protein